MFKPNNTIIDCGDKYNLLCMHKGGIGYKSNDNADIDKYPTDSSRIWMTNMSDMALKLYFKNITIVKPISELQ